MPCPDPNSVLKVLSEAKDFATKLDLPEDAAVFDEFHRRYQTEKPTLKALRRDLEPARNRFAIKMKGTLYDDRRDPRLGMESLVEQYERISVAMLLQHSKGESARSRQWLLDSRSRSTDWLWRVAVDR